MNNDKIDINKLDYDEINLDGITYGQYCLDGTPYTGSIYENFNGAYYEFKTLNGIKHGSFFSLYANGSFAADGIYHYGFEIERTEWDKYNRISYLKTEDFVKQWSMDGVLILDVDNKQLIRKDFYLSGELKILSNLNKSNLNIYFEVKSQFFSKNGDLLLTKYFYKDSSIDLAYYYNYYFTFNNSALKEHFNELCDSEIANYQQHFIGICAWIKFLLNKDKSTGVEYLIKMLEYSNNRIKYAALLIARDLNIKEVLSNIIKISGINEKPEGEESFDNSIISSYSWTISELANQVIKALTE